VRDREPAILASFGFLFMQDRDRRAPEEGGPVPVPGVRTIICASEKCRKEFGYLPNREKGTTVPVDVGSLSEDDLAIMKTTGRSTDVDFDGKRHVSHFYTCLEPQRFSRRRKKH
jgi:hypothetical protein